MATSELYPLLDFVLSSDPQDLCNSEKEVGRLSFHLRSVDPKDASVIREYIQGGISARNYNRKNSELVLLYLENALKGSAATLRLFSKVTHHSGRRHAETDLKRKSARADLGRPPFDLDRSEVPPSETSVDETEQTEKQRLSDMFKDIDGREKRGRERVAILRVAISDLERVRKTNLSTSFTRILVHHWQRHASEAHTRHITDMRAEVCKRLIAQYRRAAAFQKATKVNTWKTAALSSKTNVKAAMLRLLLRNSNTSFQYRKKQAFDTWKDLLIIDGKVAPANSETTRCSVDGDNKGIKIAVLRGVLKVYKRVWAGKLAIWRSNARDALITDLTEKINLRRILQLGRVLDNCSKGQKQALVKWKILTFPPPARLFPSLDEYKSALKTIVSHLYRPLYDAMHIWHTEAIVYKLRKMQTKTSTLVAVLQGIYAERIRKVFIRPIITKAVTESRKNYDPTAAFLYRFSTIGLRAASRKIAESFRIIQQFYIAAKSDREAVIRKLIAKANYKTLKAFSYWKTLKIQHARVVDAWRFMKAAELLSKLGLRKCSGPLRSIVKLYPTIRQVCNHLSSANNYRMSRGFSQWKLFLLSSRGVSRESFSTAAKFQAIMLRLSLRRYKFSLKKIAGEDTTKDKLVLRVLVQACQTTMRHGFRILQGRVWGIQGKTFSEEYKALLLQTKLEKAGKRGKKEAFSRVVAGKGRIIAAIRSFATRLQGSERAAVEKWKQVILKNDVETVETQLKGQIMVKKLEKVARKPLRSGLIRKPEITIGEIGQKLGNSLSKIPAKVIKLTFDRIINHHFGNLKLKIIFLKLKNPIKTVFRNWSEFVANRKLTELSNAIRANKLREVLRKIPISAENDAFTHLFKKKNRTFDAISVILKGLEKPCRTGFSKWRIALEKINKRKIELKFKAEKMRTLLIRICKTEFSPIISRIVGKSAKAKPDPKGEKITKALEAIVKNRLSYGYRRVISNNFLLIKVIRGLGRILKEKPKFALKQWKQYVITLNWTKEKIAHKGKHLQMVLTKFTFLILHQAYNRIFSTNSRLKSAIRIIVISFSHRLKHCFTLLSKTTSANNSNLQPQLAHKLSTIIENLPRKGLKSSLMLLTTTQPKLKSTLRRLFLNFHKDQRSVFNHWKAALVKKECELVINQYRPSSVSRSAVKKTMPTSPSNSSHCDYSALFLERDGILAARLGELVQILKNVPRSALYRWKLGTFSVAKAPVIDRTKAQKVTNALIKMLRRRVRSVNFRSKSQPEFGRVTCNLQAEKMRTHITRILVPILKHTFVTIIADQIKVKRALRVIIFGFATGLKRVFKEWKYWVERAKSGGNWDLFRAQKMRDALYLVPFPKLRIGFERVITQGHRLRKAIKTIIFTFTAAQRGNLSTWKRNSDLFSSMIIHEKEVVRDNRSAYKLLHDIESLFAKVKRTVFSRMKEEYEVGKKVGETREEQKESKEEGVLDRIIHRLFGAAFKAESEAFRSIFAFAKLQKTISRLQAAHKLLTLSSRLSHFHIYGPLLSQWKRLVTQRRMKLRRFGVFSFIYNTSLSMQTGFWRWKVVKDFGEFIFPQQFTFLRHTARVLERVQSRGVAKSFLLLSVNKRQLVDGPRASQPPLRFLRFSTTTSRRSSLTDEDEFVTADAIPTIIGNKLTAPEIVAVKQMGALETFGLRMQTILSRNISAAFVSIKDEGELRELRECNDMLMDDLTKLQQGNERLMETFKESTHNLEILSKKLDILKTERVVRVLEKVSTQLPLLEALLLLKLNAGISISY